MGEKENKLVEYVFIVLSINEVPSHGTTSDLSEAFLTQKEALEYFNERVQHITNTYVNKVDTNNGYSESINTYAEESYWNVNFKNSSTGEYEYHSVKIYKRFLPKINEG